MAVRRMMWAAVAVAVMALGAAGCGTSDADTGVSAAPVTASPQPRPASTGPLTKEVVRADLDTSAADAGLPANVPEYAGMYEDAEAGTLQVCGIGFKGLGTKSTPLDVPRWEAVVRELRERGWRQARKPEKRKYITGVTYEAIVVLKQRGWTIVVGYLNLHNDGAITLTADEDACIKKLPRDASPVG
ncbi:hypothetical protein PV341_12305 [Streptomyces sp. PA03-1a]|nr:hypothetical protein [Streptomyces sp. PA03-1a]MDX2817548.1 hypothetical protein [Streptomyces sp. PA03-5A]